MTEEFNLYLEKMNAINMALNIMYFDRATGAPKGGVKSSSKFYGILSAESFGMSVSDEMAGFLKQLEKENQPGEIDKAVLRICRKDYESFRKIPVEEMREYKELEAGAQAIWEKAKEASDYSYFAPALEKLIEFKIRFADYRRGAKDRYDVYLSDYEEGMDQETLDAFFAQLKKTIVPLVKEIGKSGRRIDESFLSRPVPIQRQREISSLLIKRLGFDLNRGVLRESVHPFTCDIGQNDVRITTNYHENAFLSSFYSVLHEVGHALYEQNKIEEIADTILDKGASTGIHESQSRFYENIVGRSLEFWESIYDDAIAILGEDFKDVSAKALFEVSNIVKPSFIRIEADELTYSLHVMVRYEIEKLIMSGNYSINELPKEWNRKMEEYLGITPRNDAEGILQDVHWSGGSFGYFPSYAIGNAYSAQIFSCMKKDIPFYKKIRQGDIASIQNWLSEKIHRHGCLKTPEELIMNIAGEKLNASHYAKYLEDKFSAIYF
ncbi:MAG: carboxypeptidase M32 [Clostridiales bacterium]|nr:carboxypeptidase M32 [Clostridiales bacterium]